MMVCSGPQSCFCVHKPTTPRDRSRATPALQGLQAALARRCGLDGIQSVCSQIVTILVNERLSHSLHILHTTSICHIPNRRVYIAYPLTRPLPQPSSLSHSFNLVIRRSPFPPYPPTCRIALRFCLTIVGHPIPHALPTTCLSYIDSSFSALPGHCSILVPRHCTHAGVFFDHSEQ